MTTEDLPGIAMNHRTYSQQRQQLFERTRKAFQEGQIAINDDGVLVIGTDQPDPGDEPPSSYSARSE